MKKFLAIFMGSASALAEWKTMAEVKRKQQEGVSKQAWGKWATGHEKAIVDQGSPVGKTKRITAQGIADTTNEIGAYAIVQAESHEAAAKMFEKHPNFMIFPGNAVEECSADAEDVTRGQAYNAPTRNHQGQYPFSSSNSATAL